jgi:hypothetical protein
MFAAFEPVLQKKAEGRRQRAGGKKGIKTSVVGLKPTKKRKSLCA